MSIEIGKIIQEHREHAGLTQSDLAAKLGVSQQSVAKWESGKTAPRRQMLPALSHALNITSQALDVAHWRSRYGSVEDLPAGQLGKVESGSAVLRGGLAIAEQEQGFPYRTSEIGYRSEFRSMVKPLLINAIPYGQWDVNVRGASTRWSVDYMTDKLVVNFAHSVSPSHLSSVLHTSIRMKLWDMVTMRKMGDDKRKFIVIITMPKDMEIDVDHDPALEFQIANTAMLQRVTAEAAIMDIAIYTARSPAQVASLLNYEGAPDDQN